MITADSRYDRYLQSKATLSEQELRDRQLFRLESGAFSMGRFML